MRSGPPVRVGATTARPSTAEAAGAFMPLWPMGEPDLRSALPAPRFSRRHALRTLAALAGGACTAAFGSHALALAPDNSSKEASTSEEDRVSAVRAIPFDKLRDDVKTKLLGVVEKPSLYRRLPDQQVDCNPDLFVFFVRYPEVIINIWDLLGISNVQIKRTAAYEFAVTDGAGTETSAELVYGTKNLHLIYAEGAYEGPVLKRKVAGRCVLLLQSNYSQDANKRNVIANRLDAFVSIDNAGAEMVAKTLHPVMGPIADHNFAQTAQFLGRMSQAAEVNGDGVSQWANQLQLIDPKTRSEFQRLVSSIGPSGAAAKKPQKPGSLNTAALPKPAFKNFEADKNAPRQTAPRQR